MEVLDKVDGEWKQITIDGYALDVALRIQREYVCSKCEKPLSLILSDSKFRAYDLKCKEHPTAGRVSLFWVEKRKQESEMEYNEVESSLGGLIFDVDEKNKPKIKMLISELGYGG